MDKNSFQFVIFLFIVAIAVTFVRGRFYTPNDGGVGVVDKVKNFDECVSETNNINYDDEISCIFEGNTFIKDIQKGVITGSLSYPSEFIPDEIVVCAQSLDFDFKKCTDTHLGSDKFKYKIGYEMELFPSKYLVYSYLDENFYKAYYSEFVVCGMDSDCESHEPIVVEVAENQRIENIDPNDWYVEKPIN